jgi:DHA2 family multidrug resistance protein
MFLIGIILLATMALVTPYIQNLMGYPVLASGYLLGTRGIGTFFAMMAVGRLLGRFDARILVFIGLVLATGSLWVMVGWSPETSATAIAVDSVAQGLGLGFVFVPLNTVAFATLPGDLRTDGTAIWTLIRNLGSSVGISLIIAQLTNMMTVFHSQLAEHITPFNDGLRMPDVVGKISTMGNGLRSIDAIVSQQAAIMAYSNDFLIMTFVSLSAFPLLFLIRSPKSANAAAAARGAKDEAHAAVMD